MDRETIFLFTTEKEKRTTGNWYSMYINPERLDFPWEHVFQKTMTAKGWTVTHWRPQLITLSLAGQSGWVLAPSLLEELAGDLFSDLRKKKVAEWGGSSFWRRLEKHGQDLFEMMKSGQSETDYDLNPRKFIKRLSGMMEEDMYQEDSNGKEYYNKKYIHAYTKLFPEGVIFEGFCSRFSVNEAAGDVQSIPYSFSFVVEDYYDDTTNIYNFLKGAYELGTKAYEAGKKLLGG